MKPTIRNKLLAGFGIVLLLMAVVSAIGIYSLLRLRHSAQDATRIGGRLNAVALEIQVHNLEAQRRLKDYLRDVGVAGPQRARDMYLDEAAFEISEIETLADRAVKIAPDADKRAKFGKIAVSAGLYEKALNRTVEAVEKKKPETEALAANAAYDASAEQLHENRRRRRGSGAGGGAGFPGRYHQHQQEGGVVHDRHLTFRSLGGSGDELYTCAGHPDSRRSSQRRGRKGESG